MKGETLGGDIALLFLVFYILFNEKLSFSFSFQFLVPNKMFQPVASNHDGESSRILEKFDNTKGLMLEEVSTNLDISRNCC